MKTWTIFVFYAVVLALMAGVIGLVLTGCGETRAKTEVSASTAHVADNFSFKGEALPAETNITVEPTTQNATGAAATQPVHVAINGTTVDAPPGAKVTYNSKQAATPSETSESRVADAIGSSLTTDGDKGNFESSPQQVALPKQSIHTVGAATSGGGGSADGGGASVSWLGQVVEQISAASSAAHWAMGVGVLVLILGWGVVAFWSWETSKIQVTGFVVVTVLGTLIIGTAVILDTHPWLFAVAGVGGVLGMCVYGYEQWRKAHPDTSAPATGSAAPAGSLSTIEADAKNVYQQMVAELAKLTSPASTPQTPAADPTPAAK